MDIATFRADLPEFANVTVYSDSMVTYWLNIAVLMLNPGRWGTDLLPHGLEQFMAHNIVLEKQALDTAGTGGWPGLAKGNISSESPGAVSLSYDTSVALEENAGHWNYTVYGQRFIKLARMMGAGGIQVGAGNGNNGAIGSGTGGNAAQGWSGPNTAPGWLGS